MTDPLLRDALRIIQDVVTEAKGSPLDAQAVRRVEEALNGLAAPQTRRLDTGYSRREATILFADLRGFSAIAAAYAPEVVLGLLSSCFGVMTEIVVRHYGTIDKFMGDAIMVVFHGENPSPRDHVQRAVLCAVEMQLAMAELREAAPAGRAARRLSGHRHQHRDGDGGRSSAPMPIGPIR